MAGTRPIRGRDAGPIWWWTIKGKWHQTTSANTSAAEKAIALTWMAALVAFCWYLVPVQALIYWRGKHWLGYFYLNEDRTACIAVTHGRKGWTIAEHWCRNPGTGQARTLREVVCGNMCAAADRDGVPIHCTAASRTIVPLYQQALPGAKPTTGGGRRLIRQPAPATEPGRLTHGDGCPPPATANLSHG